MSKIVAVVLVLLFTFASNEGPKAIQAKSGRAASMLRKTLRKTSRKSVRSALFGGRRFAFPGPDYAVRGRLCS